MEPITNEEKYLAALTGESVVLPDPITRKEIFLAAAAGVPVSIPDPITREEMYLSQIKPGDGSGVVIKNQNKTITENGSYRADSGYTGLGTVTVAVPIPEVEEPVLEPLTVTENGEFTPREGVDGFDKVTVNVARAESSAKIASGTFTMTSNSATTPEIIHNLGTKKIIALFWIAHNEVVATAGYQTIAASFINTPEFLTESVSVDCTGYNTKVTEPLVCDFNELCLGSVIRSPWATQANLTLPNVCAGIPSASTITDNSLIYVTSGHNNGSSTFISGYTYNYLIIGL